MSKRILITGAGSGIGKDSAYALAQRGHDVIATTETEEQAQLLKKECASLNVNLSIFKLDITLEEDRKKIEAYDLDVLINNAAIGETGPLSEIDLDRVRQNFEVNVFSTFEISQLALISMMKKNKGTILFISSLAGRIAFPFFGPYCMTKFALTSGTEALRGEIKRVQKNVHISLIEPGGYHTGFNQRMIAKKYTWMDEQSYFHSITDKIRKEEERQFRLTESKTTDSIVRKIVRASEARKPRLRYAAPGWQAFGVQLLRIFGK